MGTIMWILIRRRWIASARVLIVLDERLNLIKIDTYPELVNLAISQEDAMKRAQQDRKRKFNQASGSGQGKKFKFVKKDV
jgi:hypothetical protein